jgi:hypothetical protein
VILVANEDVDRPVVERLRQDGHDVVYVAELARRGMSEPRSRTDWGVQRCRAWPSPYPTKGVTTSRSATGRCHGNAKPDAGRLAAGIPSSNFWAFRLPGRQPGRLRLHGAGFRAAQWVGDHTESRDPQVRRSGDAFLALVKNTYRVLLTRGLKGCYVFFQDEATRAFVRSRIE